VYYLYCKVAIITKLNDQKWTVDLSKGSLTVIVPFIDILDKNIFLNPMLNKKGK